MATSGASYLVTGSMGCIGAWTLYHLVKAGKQAVSFDLSDNRSRLNLLLSPEEQKAITFVKGDLTDVSQVLEVMGRVTHLIHLAALQIPFCKADPALGATVNVVGTVNIFEAARQVGLHHLAYASSLAVYGPPEDYPPGLVTADAPFDPRTLYGVYKQANEGTARIYWQDHQLSSTALRPYTVYGVGRDQGLTSEPTNAMLAAAAGEPFHISFGGRMQFHFASDVARQFIEAAETPLAGAFGFNLGSEPVGVAEVATLINALRPATEITCADSSLPFPEGLASGAYEELLPGVKPTPLVEGIRQTIEHFEACLADGRLTADAIG
ncbi:MAG: NAD-dependent epimerase/dehydratase family protein [Trueperaceae bacterium]|nr:MAG: NAD-dependent epimerase/dehydratase family protein [Trueperaceae bacterium]